ncbi:GSCOCG00006455001-RA-CDS [Cotesia congregata]|nr:GSCOCG00006455001-RA-CDS [Cotesia congregata]
MSILSYFVEYMLDLLRTSAETKLQRDAIVAETMKMIRIFIVSLFSTMITRSSNASSLVNDVVIRQPGWTIKWPLQSTHLIRDNGEFYFLVLSEP